MASNPLLLLILVLAALSTVLSERLLTMLEASPVTCIVAILVLALNKVFASAAST